MNNYIGIYPSHFRDIIIRPTLKYMEMWSKSAEQLILGTAIHESLIGKYLKQLQGPALGVYQIEPATHKSIWKDYIVYRESIVDKIVNLYPGIQNWNDEVDDRMLVYDLQYATIICRILYYRHKESLPNDGDILGQAQYWKKYYNTELGKGKKSAYISSYQRANIR